MDGGKGCNGGKKCHNYESGGGGGGGGGGGSLLCVTQGINSLVNNAAVLDFTGGVGGNGGVGSGSNGRNGGAGGDGGNGALYNIELERADEL